MGGKLLILVLAYFLSGRLGLAMPYFGSHVTLVWLPTGIAVAALLRWGRGYWPGIYLGAFLVNLSIGSSWYLAAGIAVGNTLGPMLAAWLLGRAGFHPGFDRRQDITFFVLAAGTGMLASATGGAASLCLAGVAPWSAFGPAWGTWWLGDTVGVLLGGPLLLTLTRAGVEEISGRRGEFLAWCGLAVAVGWGAFIINTGSQPLSLGFLPLPLIAWAALRFGVTGASFGVLLISAIAAWGTATGRGTFHAPDVYPGLLLLWAFMVTMVLMGLLITAMQAERKQVEEAVRRERGVRDRIIESLPGIFYLFDAAGRFLMWNKNFETVLKCSGEEVARAVPLDFFAGEDKRLIEETIHRVFMEGLATVEAMLVGKDGTKTPYYFTGLRIDMDGQPGVVGLGIDITERKAAETALQQLNENLEQRVREELAKNREKDIMLIQQSRLAAMGEMVSNIAHQWRQPLNTVNLILANIQDAHRFGELDDEALNRAVADGNRVVQRMSRTIDDFRNFFLPNKEKKPFALREAVREALALVEASFHYHGVACTVEGEDDPQALGYENEYAQVLLNLLNNAKEAIVARGVEDGRVTVRLERQGDEARVVVRDNGGGIAPDVLPKVFEPYFSTKETGTGIGLYMSKMIIEKNMNGRIEAANADGGAEFTIVCPLWKA